MTLFFSTLNQILFLFGFIAIGYVLTKTEVLPKSAAEVLSKLENTVFIPALVASTFIEHFTPERIAASRGLFLTSVVIALIAIALALLAGRLLVRDRYTQKIFTYGLSFSNFGFLGNAVVLSLFSELFFEYLIFTLVLWILIYVWGVPHLLMADAEQKRGFKESLKALCNPMFIAMILGMAIGLCKIPIPEPVTSLLDAAGACMSPIAMLLTGVVVAALSFKETFTNTRIYFVSLLRLVVFPLIFVGVSYLINFDRTTYLCALCSLAMPLGLNTIVIPAALGRDTKVAAGMAVISHLLAIVTIPLLFSLVGR